MATKKKEVVEELKEEVKEEIKEEPKEEKPAKGKHKVYFPPSEFEGDDYVTFGINGNVTLIKRGYEVEVDDDLYENIQNVRADEKVAFDRVREAKKDLEKLARL